eukprot:m.95054 g.95054  ORF g.95054 m.95054 type:complete len:106 (-) comp26782_c1_seq2:1406-1723(-)
MRRDTICNLFCGNGHNVITCKSYIDVLDMHFNAVLLSSLVVIAVVIATGIQVLKEYPFVIVLHNVLVRLVLKQVSWWWAAEQREISADHDGSFDNNQIARKILTF